MTILVDDLPPQVTMVLNEFVESARAALGDNLTSVVLYGSAAEGRLRATSDVNLILVLKTFDRPQIQQIREKLRLAHAAIQLSVMFLLENEITAAAEAFSVKFADILQRHRLLYGPNPFGDLHISRDMIRQRLQQVLINTSLRLRKKYALISAREEQLVPVLADLAGPLRSCAAVILDLEGIPFTSPKEALETLTQKFPAQNWTPVLKAISQAREEQRLVPGTAEPALIGAMALLEEMDRTAKSI